VIDISRFLNRAVLVSRKEQIATALSICGHPFLFSPVIALLAGCRFLGPVEAVVGLATVLLFCLLPASLYILRKVRVGQWSDLDVSARKDRPHLFVVGLGFLLITVFVLMLTQQPMIYARGCLAAMILVSAGWLLNRWLKPSMHAAFAMMTASALWLLSARLAVLAMLFAAAVGWSRVALQRHSVADVCVGLALGVLVARLLLF
jgi:membrane-associated phospholipid phosphatase